MSNKGQAGLVTVAAAQEGQVVPVVLLAGYLGFPKINSVSHIDDDKYIYRKTIGKNNDMYLCVTPMPIDPDKDYGIQLLAFNAFTGDYIMSFNTPYVDILSDYRDGEVKLSAVNGFIKRATLVTSLLRANNPNEVFEWIDPNKSVRTAKFPDFYEEALKKLLAFMSTVPKNERANGKSLPTVSEFADAFYELLALVGQKHIETIDAAKAAAAEAGEPEPDLEENWLIASGIDVINEGKLLPSLAYGLIGYTMDPLAGHRPQPVPTFIDMKGPFLLDDKGNMMLDDDGQPIMTPKDKFMNKLDANILGAWNYVVSHSLVEPEDTTIAVDDEFADLW